jgi:hypothetical protein
MKRVFLLISMMVLAVSGVNAASVTVAQAQAAAQRFTQENRSRFASGNTGVNLQLAYTARSNGMDADYYVFNLKADGGFIVVGGDDLAQPVWGYSTRGAFDFDKLPENMRWWLSEYQRQLSWLREHPDAGARQISTPMRGVAPLMTSTWGQDEPFNRYCPRIVNMVAPSGCLATAMSQIMYYHRWPLQGDGDHTYSFTPYGGSEMTLSADFSQSTYDWGNMLDSYQSAYNELQADAVAHLMSDVGISIDMEYNAYESYAYYNKVIEALMAYFDYSPSMNYLLKDYYSGDWDEMLRGEIDANRPIYYFGQTPYYSGHAFVLDGYDDNGYFHVNWGWNGWYDNYFLTSLLRPYVENDPDEHNYCNNQGAIVGIEPDNTGSGGIVMKSGIIPAAATMPADDVKASFDIQALGGPYTGTLKFIVSTKTGESSYSWYYVNVVSIDVSLAAGERKTIEVNREFYYLDEGETYYFFLINPYVTVANYYWCTPVGFTVGDWPLVVGDVNGDNHVSIADVTALIDYLLSHDASSINIDAADCNHDNSVSIADVTKLIDYLLNGTWD